jgi:cysteine-rich repeat protein
MWMMCSRAIVLACLLVGASCVDEDGGSVDAGAADVALADVVSLGDAGVDASHVDAAAADAAPCDASVPDAAEEADATLDCHQPCVASGYCVTAACVAGACVETPLDDGTECPGVQASICVEGSCTIRGCGDGYREPGPDPVRESCDDGSAADDDACSSSCEPRVLVVAARPGGRDRPAGAPRHAAAADGRGEVLVVWPSQRASRSFAVMARRYSAKGVARGAAFVVSDGYFDGDTLQPTVAGGASGWAVAFTGVGATGDADGTAIALAPVDGDGLVGPSKRANMATFSDQRDPVLVGLSSGGFAVAWTDRLASNAEMRVLVRTFTRSLEPASAEVVVGSGEGASDQEPTLAAGTNGFAVAWTRSALGASPEVLARRFSAAGTLLDDAALEVSEIDVSGGPLDGSNPAIAARPDGSYVVAWTTYANDVRGDVRARALTSVGLPGVGASFAVSERPNAVERLPALVAQGEGIAVLVHRGSGQSSELRDLELVYVGVPAPPEILALDLRLATSTRQAAGSLALVPGAIWLVWAEDPFVPSQSPATLAYLIPSVDIP